MRVVAVCNARPAIMQPLSRPWLTTAKTIARTVVYPQAAIYAEGAFKDFFQQEGNASILDRILKHWLEPGGTMFRQHTCLLSTP